MPHNGGSGRPHYCTLRGSSRFALVPVIIATLSLLNFLAWLDTFERLQTVPYWLSGFYGLLLVYGALGNFYLNIKNVGTSSIL